MKHIHKLLFVLSDFIIIISAYAISLLLRFKGLTGVADNQWSTLIFLLILIPTSYYMFDLYNRFIYIQRLRVFFRIIRAWLASLVIYVIIGFLTKYFFLIQSRVFIILFFGLSLVLFFAIRVICFKKILETYFADPRRKLDCNYIGPIEKSKEFGQYFKDNVVTGLTFTNLGKSSKEGECKNTFLYSQAMSYDLLYKEIMDNLMPGYTLHVASKLFNNLRLDWEWCEIDKLPVYTFRQRKNQFTRDCLRRCLDIIGSIIGLIVLAPFFAITAIAIKLDSTGPAIYKQKRCGKDGKEFVFYKFRSMSHGDGAEPEPGSDANSYINRGIPKEETIKDKHITDVGRILRKTSIDEWPQFINILKGEMSLVGPRPHRPHEVKCYGDWHKNRLTIKQGLTGLWQIYGRGEMPCDKSIFLDLIYVTNRSLSLDLRLLLETVPAVILGRGAY
ncbi:MAG: exopolysaccharide biosynthesis polyprenyl glycosylphosphotransferase [bacterium]